MLEHLVVVPRGGLCNRLRAIASAKRVCSQTGAKCSIVWDWGDYAALFDDDTEWIPYAAELDRSRDVVIPGYHHIRHLHPHEGGTGANRRVPVTSHPRIVVTSWYVFASDQEKPLEHDPYEEPVLAWVPKPHRSILERVEIFRANHFFPSTVGMHIRRTDHKRAIARSPDEAYFREGDRLVDSGHRLFLATDNDETLRVLQTRYGDRVFHYPKSSPAPQRWPRAISQFDDVTDDLVDLRLLASCDFIIGTQFSSFSRVAMLFNGSPRCKALDSRPEIWRARLRRLRVAVLGGAPAAVVRANGVFGLSLRASEKARALSVNGAGTAQAALKRLLAAADDALRARPVSVVEKPTAAASGDPRDYLSFAPYFWPDSSKTDGLPYVHRDCAINPESMSERSDKSRLMQMARTVETLAVAYSVTTKEDYAEAAARHLRAWFIDAETRMNPNLNYAQVIPGRGQGRSFGVLDGQYVLPALDASDLLRYSVHWTDADREKITGWAREFLNWLRTSSYGKTEAAEKNNHGTLYDVQVIHFALSSGEFMLAQRIAEAAKKRRILGQIRRDGSQPHELNRPEALKYSQYNLAALFKLATRAEHARVNLWDYQGAGGVSIRKALDFIMPYLDADRRWPYPGTQKLEDFFAPVLLQASRIYGSERYRQVVRGTALSSLHFLDFVR